MKKQLLGSNYIGSEGRIKMLSTGGIASVCVCVCARAWYDSSPFPGWTVPCLMQPDKITELAALQADGNQTPGYCFLSCIVLSDLSWESSAWLQILVYTVSHGWFWLRSADNHYSDKGDFSSSFKGEMLSTRLNLYNYSHRVVTSIPKFQIPWK